VAGNSQSSLGVLDPATELVTSEVFDVDLKYRSRAALEGSYTAPPDVVSSGRAGVVTAVSIAVGDIMETGMVVYSVDGVPVRAYRSGVVLYRTLTEKDHGRDVKVAQRLLNRVLEGTDVQVDGTVGWDTVQAIRKYELSIGVSRPTGVFDPSWFVRIPAKNYKVGHVALVLGTEAPGLGQSVLSAAVAVRDVHFEALESKEGPDGAYVFVSEGKELGVSRSGNEWTVEDVEGVEAILGIPNPDGSAKVSEGVVSLREPHQGQGVPPSSIVTSSDGSRSCVVVAQEAQFVATQIDVVESSIDGLAVLEPLLPPGTLVAVNPGDVAPDLKCP
jgi:peptidoglycan hydrolase-like protein with peptidoglycan-binding domain